MNNSQSVILKTFTLLCVEDEASDRDELAQFLGRRVKQLYLASNGAEGLAMFKEHSPDIVITDIQMPIMNGLDMTKEIKAINPDVPVIVTTAFNNHDYFLRSIEMGVNKYVLKPIKIQDFLKSINEVAWLLRAHRELRISATVFNASGEAIIITDKSNTVISVNPAFTLITGYNHDEIIGQNPKILNSGRQDRAFYTRMWETLKTKRRWEGEIWNRRKNGSVYPEWLTITAIVDDNHQPIYHVAIFSDLTMRKNAEQQVYHLAHYDPLTNLPNRTLLQDRLTQTIGHSARSKSIIAVLFIDLDRFKYVNDTFGHLIGDMLLQEVSCRLKASVRGSDTVARLGGDEFVVMLPQVADNECVAKIAMAILEKLTSLFVLDSHEIYISSSIGVAIYPDNGVTPESVIRAAESAMYAVKEAGRNNYRFFHNEINDRLQERMTIENTFVTALNQNQFEVLYQPIFDSNNRITCVEASLCWNKPDGKALAAKEFLQTAEETGFILQLGKWAFRTALDAIKKQQQLCGNSALKLMISISAKQLEAPDFAEYVSQALREYQFSPQCLELEISEQVLINENEARFFALNHLRSLGVFIAVEDFGLSYATLLQLSSLPIGRLKIGRRLLENAEADGKDTFTVISAVMAMANRLSLKVTMSDIDNTQAANLICEQTGMESQGHHLSKPLHLAELEVQLLQFSNLIESVTD